jgi:hypothetical protein
VDDDKDAEVDLSGLSVDGLYGLTGYVGGVYDEASAEDAEGAAKEEAGPLWPKFRHEFHLLLCTKGLLTNN